MLVFFYFIFGLYFIFLCVLIIGWEKLKGVDPEPPTSRKNPKISVIIPVRNEAKTVKRLLRSLFQQEYPKELYEVIVVDDNSTDETFEIVEECKKWDAWNLEIISSLKTPNVTPKKRALNSGLEVSSGDLIITTDGDCWMGKHWLKSISTVFQNKQNKFIAGPVFFSGTTGFWSKIVQLEFSSLIGSGGALLAFRYPLMCNGANIAFRRDAFIQVNGYEGVQDAASGDDVFLMQKIRRAFPDSVEFVKDRNMIVYTAPPSSFSNLYQQRRRWASKWNSPLLRTNWMIPVFLFIHYVSFFVLIAVWISSDATSAVLPLLILIKILLDFIFLERIRKFSRQKLSIPAFAVCELLYPIYTIIIGLAVHFGKWRWKGRRFKN